jgi:tetratricopeptide (TPR) repeat protein
MRLYRLLVSISFVACPIFWSTHTASAQDAPLTSCDTYAASPFDPQKQTTGVTVVNPALAIPACSSAVQTYPTSPRLNFQLGRAYYAAKNVREASAFFLRAAEQGYAAAETALGDSFQYGTGVSQSYADAIDWYSKAAKQRFAVAQNSLAAMYEQGLGGPRDIIAAVAWYRKAAEQGDSAAQANLARLGTNAFANTKLEPPSLPNTTKPLSSAVRTIIATSESADGNADAQPKVRTAATTPTWFSEHYTEFSTVKHWLGWCLAIWLSSSFILLFLALTRKSAILYSHVNFFLSSIVFIPPVILALL